MLPYIEDDARVSFAGLEKELTGLAFSQARVPLFQGRSMMNQRKISPHKTAGGVLACPTALPCDP
jgi:hypothetical protein